MISSASRYHPLAIVLHWTMALCFLLMLTSGLVMTGMELPKSFKFSLYQWHKSLGVLLLLAFIARVAVRCATTTPALPMSLKSWEQKAAKLGHLALYVWMAVLPLTGWLMVSASAYGLPTIVFGWFEWPHIPHLNGDRAIETLAKNSHLWLAYSFIALIAGHVAAVIKHAIFEKENLLPRMGIGRLK